MNDQNLDNTGSKNNNKKKEVLERTTFNQDSNLPPHWAPLTNRVGPHMILMVVLIKKKTASPIPVAVKEAI